MSFVSLFVSQLGTLLWKQRVNLRAELPSLLAVLLLPSLFIGFASFTTSTSELNSVEIIECKIDNLLYCNFPMSIEVSDEFSQDFESNVDDVAATFKTAASNVANALGSDYDSFFYQSGTGHELGTSKIGGSLTLSNSESAIAVWNFGKNDAFSEYFINLFNKELIAVNNNIQFKEFVINIPPPTQVNLSVGAYLPLLQVIGNQVTQEKSSNMFFYSTRAGMLPCVFWFFQYAYWMVVSTISIAITSIVGLILNSKIEVGANFVGAFFHIAFAVLLGTIFTNKKYVMAATIVMMIFGLTISSVLPLLKDQAELLYNGLRCFPLFFFMGSVSSFQLMVGTALSAACALLAAYLAPILTISDGMYTGSKINYLYFLSPKFWQEGIVALPSHEEESMDTLHDDESDGLKNSHHSGRIEIHDCVKKFGEEKVIGSMNLQLKAGQITTLLGPNGVGKSTLMRVAAGYYIPSAGEIILEGTNIFRERPWSSLKSISLCPQDNYIYEYMTIEEHMLLISSFRDMSRIDEDVGSHIDWILDTLDIAKKRDSLAKNLSGGMKRRLCLAMSVIGFPKVILCDEPSSGVDSISQRGIWKLLQIAKKKCAILLTSHTALEAVILSDSVVLMKSSEDISHTNGIQSMALALKDVEENTTTEYDINSNNSDEVANIIKSLPRDAGSEWKIASKRLTAEALPPLKDILKDLQANNMDSDHEVELQAAHTIPETVECGSPGTLRHISILMSILLMHLDRIILMIIVLLLDAGMIFLVCALYGFGDSAAIFILPITPTIVIYVSTIALVPLVQILAQERESGVSKLLFSAGVTQSSYIISNIMPWFLLSFPVSVAVLFSVGSMNGTVIGLFAIFCLYFSFYFLMMGICVALGSLLNAKTAFLASNFVPYLSVIFGLGSILPPLANTYPGAVGQVIAGLFINHVNGREWGLFALSLVVNILIGMLLLHISMLKLGNYNVISTLCCKHHKDTSQMDYNEVKTDIENYPMKDDNVFLEGKSIVKTYGVSEKDTLSFQALDDVTFAVTRGSLLGLVGKSGAGKSTLMDILSGQLSVTSGAIYVEGTQVSPTDISKVVSMCGQLDTIWRDVKVVKAIILFMRIRGYRINQCATKIVDPYTLHLIKELGMEEMLNKKTKNLSGGQKRRLAFLVSLVGDTKVVLIDEAMTGVDVETRKIMWKILQDEVNLRGRSVVVTSHELSEIEQYCNTVGILHDGKLVEMGRLDDIKKKWVDDVKLICLFSSLTSVSEVGDIIVQNHPEIIVEPPHVDVLDEPEQTRIVATYAIDLVDIKNISSLIRTMDNGSENPSLLYWSIEPQSLDDFVRSKSK